MGESIQSFKKCGSATFDATTFFRMPLGSKQFVQMPLVTSALSGMPLVQMPFDLLSVCLPCLPH